MAVKHDVQKQPTAQVLLQYLDKWHLNDTASCRLH
jgi:hypothetical protein